MTSAEGAMETKKLEQQRPPSMELEQQRPPSMDTIMESGGSKVTERSPMNRPPVDKMNHSSPRHQTQAGGRPPHAPYSKQQGYTGHPGQYAGYPGSSRPPQQLHSVVTSSFSAEDERDASHRSVFPPVPRNVNVNINHNDQQRWRGPTEGRYPPEGLEVDVRESDHEERQQPPRDSSHHGRLSIVPPSPARGGPHHGRFPPIRRMSSGAMSSNGGPYMAPPEPLKRSFWHHSRPNDEYSSSLPPEFIPPAGKRSKVSPSQRGEVMPSRTPNSTDMRDLRRPPSFFNRALSWESRDDSYYNGHSRESPRFSSADQGRSFHPMHSHHHPCPSPPAPYRDDDLGPHHMSDPSRSRNPPPPPHHNHHPYPPPSPQEMGYHHHHGSPSHAAAAAAAAANHHNRRWNSHDNWPPVPAMPSPTSGPRRSPTNYHQPYNMSPTAQFRDDVESGRGWSHGRERELMPNEDNRRLPQFDSKFDHDNAYHSNAPYHPNPHYGRTMPHCHKPMPPLPPLNTIPGRSGAPMDTAERGTVMDDGQRAGSASSTQRNEGSSAPASDGPLLLLALPQDRISLSETLCVVRENIEVFTATKSDVEAPAPGRKHAVVIDQVGLRCIHCRHTTRSSDRVKRAVCYPSSIKRIYRTVIDMKLDHFLQCKFVPSHLKERLAELKVKHTRSTGTTMQYFIRAAHSLGLEDGPNGSGVRLNSNAQHRLTDLSSGSHESMNVAPQLGPVSASNSKPEETRLPEPAAPGPSESRPIHRMDSSLSSSENTVMTPDTVVGEPETLFTGKINLALPDDKMALSPLRCFLRSQVCAFSATAEDIAVRAPTTFSITVGQVGIGCIHCVNQPSKLRSNRAVCFPFSISRIYQSVADIQRFHFGECKMLPADVKEKFLTLQKASSKGSKGLATRQYWITSAKKIGLVDTPRGIRFGRDPSTPEQTSMSLDILAQVAFNVTTASRALVLPEDKPYIAEFLYVVMEQLQPCRFTEADRNKRRLKDVGCIGVECKHCAGQVDGRKFFWSSVNAVESNFVSVHTHMMECRMVPPELKEKLAELKKLRKEQTAALKTGSQKAFFSRVWSRLHGDDGGANRKQEGNTNASASSSSAASASPQLSSSCPSPMMSEPGETVLVDGVSDDMRQMSVVEI